MAKINEKLGTNYDLFNYYGAPDADRVMIAMGSVCDVADEVIDYLNAKGEKVGIIKVRLYRPWVSSALLKVLPALVGLLTAVAMFRASGALEWLTGLCAPALEFLGIPPETTPLMLVRPVSGSGALAVGSDLIATYGPDSYIGRVAAVMLGSTETTFYTIAVYFGSAGIIRTRHTVPAALAADLTGFLASAFAVRLFFGA